VEVLDDALVVRNRLIHTFFADHSEDFASSRGREGMIHELRNAAVLFGDADARLAAYRVPTSRRLGLTEEAVASELDLMLARAHARDGDGAVAS
jgi:hypothetical protein